MDKLTPEQYAGFKKFLAIFCSRDVHVGGLPPEDEPMAILEKMEKTAPGKAMKALIVTINDCVDSAARWDADKVRDFDADLRLAGAPTLSEMRQRFSQQYAAVVKRGHIKTVEEYYMLKGVADDSALPIDAAEKQTVFHMLERFEEKVTRE